MEIIKFIPSDPFLLPGQEVIDKAVGLLSRIFPGCEIEEGSSPLPQFVDCGDSLENVRCPLCSQDIDSEDWACLMDALYTDDGFESLEITAPCCGGKTSLDRLIYQMPCGFSCIELDIIDPDDIPDGVIEKLQKETGVPFLMIRAHI